MNDGSRDALAGPRRRSTRQLKVGNCPPNCTGRQLSVDLCTKELAERMRTEDGETRSTTRPKRRASGVEFRTGATLPRLFERWVGRRRSEADAHAEPGTRSTPRPKRRASAVGFRTGATLPRLFERWVGRSEERKRWTMGWSMIVVARPDKSKERRASTTQSSTFCVLAFGFSSSRVWNPERTRSSRYWLFLVANGKNNHYA